MQQSQPADISAVLGRSMAALRQACELRQEDVAECAVLNGLDWTRATVAAIETGRRRLTAAELLLVPHVMSLAVWDRVGLGDLLAFRPEEPVELSRALKAIPAVEVLGFMDGSKAMLAIDGAPDDVATMLEERAARTLDVDTDTVIELAQQLWGARLHEVRDRRVDAIAAAQDEPVNRAAVVTMLSRAVVQELELAMRGRRGKSA